MKQKKVYFKDDDGVKAFGDIQDAIRVSDTTVRVTLESGEKAKKDGRIIAAVGDWDIWTYYPQGGVGGNKMEKFENVPKTFELPHGGVLIFNPFGKGGNDVFGSELRRVKQSE